jgi:hypothetical protein
VSPPAPAFWQPTQILRFIDHWDTGTQVIRVATDLGDGYLKAIGNPEGEHVLACEWVGTQLARWFDLPTLEFGLIEVKLEDELPFARSGKARPGPAFITRAEAGEPWSGTARELKRLVNPQDISRLVVFDTWTRNCDRYSLKDDGRLRINRNNVFLSEQAPPGQVLLRAIDHSHCFTCGRAITPNLAELGRVQDDRVYGLFPQFRDYLDPGTVTRAAERLRGLARDTVAEMIRAIPRQWDVDTAARQALEDFLVRRANYLADRIMTLLWPQGELFPDQPEGTR